MAKRTLAKTTFTPTATADTTNLVDTTYFGALLGGSSTQKTTILEVSLTGQAGSSAPSIMLLSRDSTIGATTSLGTGLTDAANDPATAALAAPVLTFDTATTKPQRSSSLHLANCSINAFGGIYRWVAAPGEEYIMVGNTASLGEISLSAFTGGTTGLMGGHIIYETA